MPRALFVDDGEPSSEFPRSVLWRDDVTRVVERDPAAALSAARAQLPNLILIRERQPGGSEELLRRLKERYETRRVPVVAYGPRAVLDETALRRAGATLVLATPADPLHWDLRLEELMSEPPRREVRLPVHFVIWPQPPAGPTEGVAHNLSVRGALLETQDPLEPGATLELAFGLPDAPAEIQVVGQIIRQEPDALRRLYGLDFIILRGDARSRIEGFVGSGTRR
jgi:PilZ domain